MLSSVLFGIFIIIQGIHNRDSRSNQTEDTSDSSNGFENSKAFLICSVLVLKFYDS